MGRQLLSVLPLLPLLLLLLLLLRMPDSEARRQGTGASELE